MKSLARTTLLLLFILSLNNCILKNQTVVLKNKSGYVNLWNDSKKSKIIKELPNSTTCNVLVDMCGTKNRKIKIDCGEIIGYVSCWDAKYQNSYKKCNITTCCDGSCSSSVGRGTCSRHGGICN